MKQQRSERLNKMTRSEFLKGVGLLAAASAAGCKTSAKCISSKEPCVGFKLGMAGGSYWRMKDYSFLEEVSSLGLNYLSVKDWHLPFTASDEQVKAFLSKCSDYRIKAYALGPVYMDTEEKAKVAFDFAARLGAKTIVGVPFVRKDVGGKSVRFENRPLAEKIAQLCAEYDMRFAIHNHGPDAPEMFPDSKSMYAMVKDLGDRMGFCLDIGHELRYGSDPALAIRKYPERIFDIHVKNVTAADKSGKAACFSRGKVDLAEVLLALYDIRFNGVCAIEWERAGTLKADFGELAESVGYFRGLADMIGKLR
jgi:sugar phosphate isomerase/epimerase